MTRVLKAGLWTVQLAGMAAIVDGIWRWSVPVALVVAGLLAFVSAELVNQALKKPSAK